MAKTKTKKRKHSKRYHSCLGGVLGMDKSPIAEKALDTGTDALSVVLGLLSSSLIGMGIDKVLKTKPPVEGEKFDFKRLVKPGVLVIVGATTSYLTQPDKDEKQSIENAIKRVVRHIGYGMVAGGSISAIKITFKKELFSGLGRTEDDQKILQAQYMRENQDLLKKLNEAQEFKAELPENASAAAAGTMGNADSESESEKRQGSIL